jgi:hypothetical protein
VSLIDTPSHRPQNAVCTYHEATKEVVEDAVRAALAAKEEWEAFPW